jgi:hypothetical protein
MMVKEECDFQLSNDRDVPVRIVAVSLLGFADEAIVGAKDSESDRLMDSKLNNKCGLRKC